MGGEDAGLEPHIAIVMPGFNEEEAIAGSLHSLLELNYPPEKLELVAVNDGSTDGTLEEMQRVSAECEGRVRVIDFPENRGKRAAMAAGIRATSAEVIVFVDSDSSVEPDALKLLVQPLTDPRVGAVCGHADVLNVRDTWITRMQAVRYFVAFRVVKAAESVFGAVTCCSGCFSAYRREAILPRLQWWESQTFLGVESTFGDDRSLTNCVLRDWRILYERRAVSHTIVPTTFRAFIIQQTRWKRSWTRESLLVAKFIWRKHPVAACFTYMSIILPLLAPIAAVHSLVWGPLTHQGSCRSPTSRGSTRWRSCTPSTSCSSRIATTCSGCTGSCSCSSTSGSCCGRPTTRSPPAAPPPGAPDPPPPALARVARGHRGVAMGRAELGIERRGWGRGWFPCWGTGSH